MQASADQVSTIPFRKLGLAAAEIAALARQGFVSVERRKRNMRIYKLRFRCNGRQRVCYLGTDAYFAAEIKTALVQHQRRHLLGVELRALGREAGRRLRAGKLRLVGDLVRAGYKFHGLDVRRSRLAAPTTAPQ